MTETNGRKTNPDHILPSVPQCHEYIFTTVQPYGCKDNKILSYSIGMEQAAD